MDPKKNTFIFLSSRKVYKSKENIKENDRLNPLSNYSKNKLITENLLKKRSYDIKIKFNHLSSGREIEIESNIDSNKKPSKIIKLIDNFNFEIIRN